MLLTLNWAETAHSLDASVKVLNYFDFILHGRVLDVERILESLILDVQLRLSLMLELRQAAARIVGNDVIQPVEHIVRTAHRQRILQL